MKSTLVAVLLAGVNAPLFAVVISEVHYHPPKPDGKQLEFVELYNTTAEEADLSGWDVGLGRRARL